MILVDDTHAAMDQKDFDSLLEYSCTVPTGVVRGKRWKRREPYRTDDPRPATWWLGEYAHFDGDPEGTCRVRWRKIIEPAVPKRRAAAEAGR